MPRHVPQAPREPIVLPPPSGASTYVPAGVTAAEAAAMLAEAHPVQAMKAVRRRRVVAEPSRPAPPHVVLHDGRPVMSVPLTGELGAGKRFIVDLLTFDRMALFVGEDWTLIQTGGPSSVAYVGSRRQQAQRAMRGAGAHGAAVKLGRWIMHAPPGSAVGYRDGDPLNLTGRNLLLWDDCREHFEAHRATRKPAGLDMTDTHRV